MSYEIRFRRNFALLLGKHFRTPEEIGTFLGCTARQAQNLLDEVSTPRGHRVAKVFTHPKTAADAQALLGET